MKRFIAAGIGLALALTVSAVAYAGGPSFTTEVNKNSNVGGYHHVCEPKHGLAAKHHDLRVVIPAASAPQEDVSIRLRVWSNNEGVYGKPTALVGGKRQTVSQDFNTIRHNRTLPAGGGPMYRQSEGGLPITLPFEVHGDAHHDPEEVVNIVVIARDAAAERWLGSKRQWIGQIKIWDYADCDKKPQESG